MNYQKILPALLLLFVLLLAHTAPPAHAAPQAKTFNVNNAADLIDVQPGDGKCETQVGNGVCTLRAAVMEANILPGLDTIKLQSNTTYKLTIPGLDTSFEAADGDLDLQDTKIIGGDMYTTIVDGSGIMRVFDPHGELTITDLTIANGYSNFGAGIYHHSSKPLTVQRVFFYNNQAQYEGGGLDAGLPSTTITDSRFEKNSANHGGGIYSTGNLTVLRTTFEANSSIYGGGIKVWLQQTNIVDSAFINNQASSGGGVQNHAALNITNTTFSQNKAANSGGGIYNAAVMQVMNATFARNTANSDANPDGDGGGIHSASTAKTQIGNTLIASNAKLTDSQFPLFATHDCAGEFTSLGYNLIGNAYGCSGFSNNDKVGNPSTPLSAKIEALQDNGGPTMTHGLQNISPAIDAGNPNGCKDTAGQLLTTDQRHYARAVDGGTGSARCDIGAFEYNAQAIPDCSAKPAAANLLTPGNGATASNRKVKLDWDDVQCATRYKILVKKGSPAGPRADKVKVTESKYKTIQLTRGETYVWRVQACNDGGCTKSSWSTFTVKP